MQASSVKLVITVAFVLDKEIPVIKSLELAFAEKQVRGFVVKLLFIDTSKSQLAIKELTECFHKGKFLVKTMAKKLIGNSFLHKLLIQ